MFGLGDNLSTKHVGGVMQFPLSSDGSSSAQLDINRHTWIFSSRKHSESPSLFSLHFLLFYNLADDPRQNDFYIQKEISTLNTHSSTLF